MIKKYTNKEYADKAVKANKAGQYLYVYVYEKEVEGEQEEYGELLIAPVNYYICFEANYTRGEVNPHYEDDRIREAKDLKFTENDSKANAYLEQTFIIPIGDPPALCQFIYNEKTERNLSSSALGFITGQYTEKEWTDEQGLTVFLTAEDVTKIFLVFNVFANAVWARWGMYKQTIKVAETYEEVQAIEIDYTDIDPNGLVQQLGLIEE